MSKPIDLFSFSHCVSIRAPKRLLTRGTIIEISRKIIDWASIQQSDLPIRHRHGRVDTVKGPRDVGTVARVDRNGPLRAISSLRPAEVRSVVRSPSGVSISPICLQHVGARSVYRVRSAVGPGDSGNDRLREEPHLSRMEIGIRHKPIPDIAVVQPRSGQPTLA